MKISHMLGYTITMIWWLVVICVQLLFPITFVLGLTVHVGFLGLSMAVGLLATLLTAWCGGLNTLPSIVWRVRKNLQTRVIERGGEYALQMKVFGGWIYVDSSEGETGAVMTAWFPDLSAYPFMLDKRQKADKYLVRLQEDIASGFSPKEHPPEVLATQVITRGNIVKPK